MTALAEAHVTVVGLGLMGGSLAGALRGQCRHVTGVDRHPDVVARAQDLGLIDEGSPSLAQGVQHADVVVLATPVRTILALLDTIGAHLTEGCLLLDVGSTKAQIVARMAALPPHVQPLGGHPMCGKEVSGVEAADPMLYQGKPFVLTPLPRTSEAVLALGRALVSAVGAHPLILEAERHDRLVATISHLPYLIASALLSTAETVSAEDPMVWEVAASGFRDTSRLAASDVTMMLDILLTNREAVLDAVQTCSTHLDSLAELVDAGDDVRLRAMLHAIHARRSTLCL